MDELWSSRTCFKEKARYVDPSSESCRAISSHPDIVIHGGTIAVRHKVPEARSPEEGSRSNRDAKILVVIASTIPNQPKIPIMPSKQ